MTTFTRRHERRLKKLIKLSKRPGPGLTGSERDELNRLGDLATRSQVEELAETLGAAIAQERHDLARDLEPGARKLVGYIDVLGTDTYIITDELASLRTELSALIEQIEPEEEMHDDG